MAKWCYRQLAVICEDIPNLQLDFLSSSPPTPPQNNNNKNKKQIPNS